ncbi:hypothetical protein BTHE68_03160 [Burkholderia sp. THE68]|nr:hypothetical protein BTHE68_03160 [Burkholderia sp. THE68]
MRFAEHNRRLARRELHRDAIDAVHAGAGHQTEVHAVRLAGFDCFGLLSHAALLFDAPLPGFVQAAIIRVMDRIVKMRLKAIRIARHVRCAESRVKRLETTRKGASGDVIA